MKKKDLKNTKFIVHDDEKEKVSIHLEKIGVIDRDNIKTKDNLFYIRDKLCVCFDYNESFGHFLNHPYKFITVDDILSVPLPEPKYRPCDNVMEAVKFVDSCIYDRDSTMDIIIGVTNGCFTTTSDAYKYNFYSWEYVFEEYKLKDGSPVGIKEE